MWHDEGRQRAAQGEVQQGASSLRGARSIKTSWGANPSGYLPQRPPTTRPAWAPALAGAPTFGLRQLQQCRNGLLCDHFGCVEDGQVLNILAGGVDGRVQQACRQMVGAG